MKSVVILVLLAVIAFGCGSQKKVYAPPFEDEEVEIITVEETPKQINTAQVPVSNSNTKSVVSREESVTMTHGNELKKYNVIVGSFGDANNAVRLRNKLNDMGYTCVIMKNENGMSRVSIAGFDQESPARTELMRVRDRFPEYSDAWLLITK